MCTCISPADLSSGKVVRQCIWQTDAIRHHHPAVQTIHRRTFNLRSLSVPVSPVQSPAGRHRKEELQDITITDSTGTCRCSWRFFFGPMDKRSSQVMKIKRLEKSYLCILTAIFKSSVCLKKIDFPISKARNPMRLFIKDQTIIDCLEQFKIQNVHHEHEAARWDWQVTHTTWI